MNGNALIQGENYACVTYVRRNILYDPNAYPVKVLYTFKEREAGNTRMTVKVEVALLNDDEDLTYKLTDDGEYKTRVVTAAQIYARWDEHAEERALREKKRREEEEHYQIQRREREARYRAEEEARQRRFEEQRRLAELKQAHDKAEEERFTNYLKMKLPLDVVLAVNGQTITIDRAKFEQLVGFKRRVL